MTREIKARNVLQKSKLPESPYCLNPYVGCSHRCAYCYARFMRRFTGHSEPWGHFVDVKVNAPEVLSQQLDRACVKGTVLIGSVCDAYQPIEKRYGLTRECIRLLIEHDVKFSVLTKSSLVLRDLDLLKRAGQSVTVGISLSMLEEPIRRKFEPGASDVQSRLETLETLHRNGISTYVFIGPILPHITNIKSIVETVAPYADEVWGEALNMRCGNREDLSQAYTSCGLSKDWQTLTRNDDYWSEMAHNLEQVCRRTNCKMVGFYKH